MLTSISLACLPACLPSFLPSCLMRAACHCLPAACLAEVVVGSSIRLLVLNESSSF
jgi:hypothetical protein